MKKHTTKRLLGAAGLLIVGAMTAFATTLPGPNAQATISANSDIDVAVNVHEGPAKGEDKGNNEENGNPRIKVNFNDTICRIEVQATNIATGEDLFDPIFSYTIGVPRPADNSATFDLPFAERGAAPGDYVLTIYAISCTGANLGSTQFKINYPGPIIPPVPNTANTGDLNVLGVNLARADFIAMGTLIVSVATVCLILFLRKKHHK